MFQSEFRHVMKHLPVPVYDWQVEQISKIFVIKYLRYLLQVEEMFSAADTDGDGQLSFAEFSVMVTPPAPPEIPRFTLQINVQTVLLHNNAVNMNISQKIQKILIFYSIHNPYIPMQLQTGLSDVLTGASSKVKMQSVDIILVWTVDG